MIQLEMLQLRVKRTRFVHGGGFWQRFSPIHPIHEKPGLFQLNLFYFLGLDFLFFLFLFLELGHQIFQVESIKRPIIFLNIAECGSPGHAL